MNQSEIQLHPEGKIDVHQRQQRYNAAFLKFTHKNTVIAENKKLILEFLRDCALGKTVIGRSKKRIGPARCHKYLSILGQVSNWLGKSFLAVMQHDMENLIERLEGDRLISAKGKPFAEATKADIKKTIKKFWKWKDGKNKTYPELVEWIESYDPVKDVQALRKEEVEKMVEHCANPRDKALLMVLLDSGARAEELLNVRLKSEHLVWKEDLGCYKMRIEFSKTKPRTISLPLCTNHLRAWLDVHPAKGNDQAQLFPMSYGNLRMQVRRIGQRVLGKKVSPHMLRHSSATFYANKLSRYQLCYRYGWTMSSRVVDRYLDREGILEEGIADVVKADEMLTAHKQNQTLREELSLVKESNAELASRFQELQEELQAIRDGKGWLSMLMDLKRRQDCLAEMVKGKKRDGFDFVFENGDRVT